MNSKQKRPISVWLAQIFLLVYGAIFALGAFLNLSEINQLKGWPQERAIWLTWFNGLIAGLMLGAFLSMIFRWTFGRWLSVIVFCLISAVVLYRFFTDRETPLPSNLMDFAILIAPMFFLFLGPILLLTLMFILSSRVKRFFAGELDLAFTDPPPPPTFES
jgi:hypothetical protein